MKVSERLGNRLAKVPKVTPEDIGNWLAEAEAESELTEEVNANAIFILHYRLLMSRLQQTQHVIFLIQMVRSRLINR